MELIIADADFNELGELCCFVKFDAQAGMSIEEAENDFELVLHENIWAESPIQCGYYVYVPGTQWGGRAEKIVHSASDGRVRIYGTCWRGLLERFAVVPPEGETHFVVKNMEANAMLGEMLGDTTFNISVSSADSGIICSGSIRYKSLLNAAETLLSKQGARLCVSFENGQILISAEPAADYRNEIEFSQEYDSSLVSTRQGSIYNHIIALGQGTMENRDIIELWSLPDGTVTNDPDAEGIPSAEDLRTYIYDYSAVESKTALEEAARRKLSLQGEISSLEISIGSSDICLELGDAVSARDILTGMTAELTVAAIRLVIEENSVQITHRLS